MQGPSLSPQELSFINQHGPIIDSVAVDLSALYQQMSNLSYVSLITLQDNIISRIRPLASYTRDVEYTLRALSHQTLDLIHHRLPALVIDFQGEEIPVLFTMLERANFDGSPVSLNYTPSAGYRQVDPQQGMRAVGEPLAKFLASRSTQAVPAASTNTPNVTVSNTQNGWQIVYSPYYVSTENGFGGPSTPVDGYLSPGAYRFGIKKTAPAQWDSTSWSIPSQPNVYIPLP